VSSRLNFFLFISFALGIIASRFLTSFFTFLILFLFSFFLAYLFYKRNKLFLADSFILIIFLCLGSLWQISNLKGNVNSFLKQESQFSLKVVSLPKVGRLDNSFIAQIEEINGQSVKQKVRLRDYTKSLAYLSRYQLPGKLTRRKYHQRWFYYLWVKSRAQVLELPLGFWEKLAKNSSSYILGLFKENCSDQAYRFLSAVFLGRRELLGQQRELFSSAGISHLLAISGLHIGLTSVILFFFLRFLGIPFRLGLGISLGFLYFYTFLTGASPSTLRAVIMYSVFSFSFFLKRRPDSFNSLGLAGLVCLLIEPSMLFTIGFQLSFLAVFAILIGYKLFSLKLPRGRFLSYLIQIFFCSLLVTIFIAPLASYYFGKIHILGIVYNVLMIPFFTLILGLNFLLLILSPFAFIAQSLGTVLSLLIAGFVTLVRYLGAFKFSYFSCQFSSLAVFIYYCLLAGIVFFINILRFDKTRLL